MKARSRATRVSGMVSIMLSFGLIVAAVEVGSVHAASTDPAVVGQWTAPTTMMPSYPSGLGARSLASTTSTSLPS